jgi:hypothetical protein
MTIQLLQELLEATEHYVDGLLITRKVSPHECLELYPSSILFSPETRDLIETLLCARSLLLTMLRNEFFFESRDGAVHPRLSSERCRGRQKY